MAYPPFPVRPLRRVSLALAFAAAAPALAQYPSGAVVQSLPGADDPAEKLAAALRTLAVSPRDLGALIEAGRDALTLGDPNAAVGFFGRASEVSPRDGRVKAGLGAALVQLEKPRDALRYFGEASTLGVPDADLAEDRGLAYDLVGDPARAQRDYQTVLAAHPDDDAARRRLALSQGISGNRAEAIATLDPLIRKRDIAAWRAQTFVLAMTGDTKGANDITRVMLPQQQAMLQPFLERLATLSPGDKARAVHFGEMPAGGRNYSGTQLAAIGTPPTYAPAPAPAPAPVVTRSAPPPAVTPAPVTIQPARQEARAAPVAAPPVTGRGRFVSPTGVPMRRIEHSGQEMMALGVPRYEYVPMGTAGASRAPATAAVVAVASPPTAAADTLITRSDAAAPAPEVQVAAQPPSEPRVATAAPSVAAPVERVVAPPPRAVETPGPASLAASLPAAMPLGGSGDAGHFDVPHEIADRRPVPRTEQPSARLPVVAVPRPEPAPVVTTPRPEPAVTAARRASGGTALAANDHPVRTEPARDAEDKSTVQSSRRGDRSAGKTKDEGKASPSDADDAATDRKAAHGSSTATRKDADAPDTRKGRRGDHGQTAARGDDADRSGKARGKADDDRKPGDKETRSKKGGRETDPSEKADKADKASSGAGKVYVQVAGGANREDMDKAWAGVKAKAPELMKGRTPSTTPLKATNRLLVGPFKSEDEAQAFVNKMAGKGLSGFTFKSGKGQKVDKVDIAR